MYSHRYIFSIQNSDKDSENKDFRKSSFTKIIQLIDDEGFFFDLLGFAEPKRVKIQAKLFSWWQYLSRFAEPKRVKLF